MAVLWCGGEDIDFPNGQVPSMTTVAGRFRANYARAAMFYSALTDFKSIAFPGGAITSAWFSCYIIAGSMTNAALVIGGLCNLAGTNGIFVGINGVSTNGKLAVLKGTSASPTVLASASSFLLSLNVLHKVDLRVINFGGSGTATVYLNGTEQASFTGDLTSGGITNLDGALGCNRLSSAAPGLIFTSEYLVADEDTRTFSLVTLAPNAAGDSNDWTGAFTTIDEIILDDADLTFSNAVNQTFLCNVSNLPTGNFSVKHVKLIARAFKTNDATPTTLKLGVKSGGSTDVDAGRVPTTAWVQYERHMAQNPIGPAQWTPTDINTLQLALQTAA